MTTNADIIKRINRRTVYRLLFDLFGMMAFVFLFLGVIYIMEGFHSALTDVAMLGIGVFCSSLSVFFLRKA